MPTPRYGNPPALQAKIDHAMAPVQVAPAEQPTILRYHPNRADRRAAKAQWGSYASQVRASLGSPREEPLEIWLPGLQLYSENVALRGDKMPGREHRDKIAVQSAALNEARIAFMASDSVLWRVSGLVAIEVRQHGRKRDIDPGNLFHKPVVDCLVGRGGVGLGVLEDDSAKYVADVLTGYGKRELTGVTVAIRPVESIVANTETLATPELVEVAEELLACASYWSDYDVPLGIVDRLRAAVAAAKERCA